MKTGIFSALLLTALAFYSCGLFEDVLHVDIDNESSYELTEIVLESGYSPSIGEDPVTGLPLKSDRSAASNVIPAEGPSLGIVCKGQSEIFIQRRGKFLQ